MRSTTSYAKFAATTKRCPATQAVALLLLPVPLRARWTLTSLARVPAVVESALLCKLRGRWVQHTKSAIREIKKIRKQPGTETRDYLGIKTNGWSVHLAGHLRHEVVFGMMSAGLLTLSSPARMFYSPFVSSPVAPKRSPSGIHFPFSMREGWDVYAATPHLSVILAGTC